jgi:hypothetical protein
VAIPKQQTKIRTIFDYLVTEIELTIVIALGYAGTMVIVTYGVKVLQSSLYDHPLLAFTSLVFLPHGIRILAAFLVGARSIIPLMIGALITSSSGLDGGTYPLVSLIPGVTCGYLAFKVFELAGFEFKPGFASLRQWRGIVLVSFVAALLNGLGIVGRLKVVNTPYPDPLQFDLKSSCFDPASNQNPSRARAGDLRFISAFSQVIKLAVLKADRF